MAELARRGGLHRRTGSRGRSPGRLKRSHGRSRIAEDPHLRLRHAPTMMTFTPSLYIGIDIYSVSPQAATEATASTTSPSGLARPSHGSRQNNFDGYEILRIDAAPKEVHVHLLPNERLQPPARGASVNPACRRWQRRSPTRSSPATERRIRSLPIGIRPAPDSGSIPALPRGRGVIYEETQ